MNNPLFDFTVRNQVFLEGLKSGEVNQFTAFLKRIDKEIKSRLIENDLTAFSRTRLEKLLKSIEKALANIYSEYYDELAGSLIDIAEYQAELEAKTLDAAVTESQAELPDIKRKSFESTIPAATQIYAAVFATPLSVRGVDGGKLLDAFINDWAKVERQRVVGAIRQGFFEGQTNAQIIQNIRGTRANNYRDGLLAISNRNAEAIVRTSIQHVASVARFETWKANDDILEGYTWASVIDSRTTSTCRSLDGVRFELGKGPRPPAHIRCRSTTIAALKDEFSFLSEGRTRASMHGPIDGKLTYYDWLKTQPVSFQNQVLGKTRAQLFRNGGLSAERFAALNLGRHFKPLTLDQMRKLEPAAFERAFSH
ncbi:minor capsid protein [Endozoicomonas sp. SM1973]|uniref:Minor capsid protein n=1 Tax=Spartinivicinus marinus TaxID=2994442 RepID=A0A853IF09_9GAMM|nr:minor capsid protein [Spartinivicinus marinus]NYZ69118.1 minor capsid protein [Spartinivicinus marinus]